jgi:hypothetical protein
LKFVHNHIPYRRAHEIIVSGVSVCRWISKALHLCIEAAGNLANLNYSWRPGILTILNAAFVAPRCGIDYFGSNIDSMITVLKKELRAWQIREVG